MGDKGRQALGKASPPSNTWTHVGRQLKTRGDKTSAWRRPHPTKGNKKGDKRQDLEKADTPSNKGNKKGYNGRHGETRGNKNSAWRTHHQKKGNKKGHNGRQGETRCREGGHTIQQKETRRETRGEKTSGRRKADTLRKHLEPLTVHCSGKNPKGHPNSNDILSTLKPAVLSSLGVLESQGQTALDHAPLDSQGAIVENAQHLFPP
jgi:hypothetical protein